MRYVRTAAATLILTAAIAGCRNEPVPPDVVAMVGERYVSLPDFKRYLERSVGAPLGQLSSEAASALFDQYVEEIVVAEYALAAGIDIPAERITAEVQLNPGAAPIEIRDELLRDAILASITRSATEPTAADVERYYREHPAEFTVEDRVHVRQILLKSASEAEAAHERLRKGEDFAELAKELSVAPTADRGGDIGVVARGDLPRAVEQAVFSVGPGQISDVVETAGSFHIFQVLERLPAGTIDLGRATPLIESRLRGEVLTEQVRQTTITARQEIPVTVFSDRLPFGYSGTFSTASTE